jgi:hypothetical protein
MIGPVSPEDHLYISMVHLSRQIAALDMFGALGRHEKLIANKYNPMKTRSCYE